jgi:hypothetical protein
MIWLAFIMGTRGGSSESCYGGDRRSVCTVQTVI